MMMTACITSQIMMMAMMTREVGWPGWLIWLQLAATLRTATATLTQLASGCTLSLRDTGGAQMARLRLIARIRFCMPMPMPMLLLLAPEPVREEQRQAQAPRRCLAAAYLPCLARSRDPLHRVDLPGHLRHRQHDAGWARAAPAPRQARQQPDESHRMVQPARPLQVAKHPALSCPLGGPAAAALAACG